MSRFRKHGLALLKTRYIVQLSLGGAEIDGFSSIQAGTQLDDHFVVRPSSKIVDYDILNEQSDDLHYAITIEAAVGEIRKTECQNRPVNNVTMFAPVIVIDNEFQLGCRIYQQGLVKDIYDQMAKKPDVKMINKADVLLDPELISQRICDIAIRPLHQGLLKSVMVILHSQQK